MKLVDIEYEHSSNQLTVDAMRGRFITALNDNCKEIIEDLKKGSFKAFLRTGIHLIKRQLDNRKKELNKDIILTFWDHIEKKRFVCKFDILEDIYVSDKNDETVTVATHLSQYLLHPICKKWANKLTNNYFVKPSEVNKLYDLSIVEKILPCPWIYLFWKSASLWMNNNNLSEVSLEDKWLLRTIVLSFDYWASNPQKINEFGLLESSLHHNEYLETIEPPLGLPKWEPQRKEKETYLAEVNTLAKQQLKRQDIFKNKKLFNTTLRQVNNFAETYCNKVEKHFRSNGWKKVKVKKEFEKHLEWTIRFQVKEESYSKIAKDYNVYASSVKKEVEEILNTIGLKKREIKRGRLKGQKTSESANILTNLGK